VAIRIVLADDHPIVLQALQHLFTRQGDVDVVACCVDARSALDAVRTQAPDVALLDLRMPGIDGEEFGGLRLLADIARERPECRRAVLTASITNEQVLEVLRLGASGLILKDSPPDRLVECVRRVHAGEQWLDPDSVSDALREVVNREAIRGEVSQMLTAREIEIARMVAQGLRNRVISERLGIAESTVKVHLYNIYQKLEIEGRVELVLFAQQKGLV
jgi:two-component system, NarL family, nitrate/nitrite response regulator NarL